MRKSVQAKAKGHLHDIWQAETRVDAEASFDSFEAAYRAKIGPRRTSQAHDTVARKGRKIFYSF